MWESFIETVTKVNDWVNGVVWGWPMIVMILGTGILLTVRTKVLQVRKFGESLSSTIVPVVKGLGKKQGKRDKNSVSQFEAFSAAISGTVGTGNIIGVTSAILTGGPGAVMWMWISAFVGMVTNYSENVLGLYYRRKEKDGSFSGGAFYYIAYGLKQNWLGLLAAVFCLLAATGMSGVQTNKITGSFISVLNTDEAWVKLLIGSVVALLAAVVIIGGIKRIGRIASMLVPFMSVLFIIMSFIIIGKNIGAVPETFRLIFSSAFSAKAVAGGVGGFVFSQIIKKGLARGVFSNEAGLGSSVIAHSASETREPVKQGLWGIFEVFFDTFVICTLTALVVLNTNIGNGSYENGSFFGTTNAAGEFVGASDSAISLSAFSSNLGTFGTVTFLIILPLFAFTTILAWSYYGEKAMDFCFRNTSEKSRKTATMIFKVAYILLIVFSSLIGSDLIWALDDTFNGLMALPNLIALVLLSGQVAKITKNYFDRKKGKDVEPMLSAYPEQNEEFKAHISGENS